MGWGTWCVLPCTVSTTSFVAEHDCQTCRISRPYRDAQDRLLWRENNLSRTSLAHHELESVNIIVIINKWQQVGSKILPPAANFDQFSDLFLARFVKPSDSAKTHKEIPVITQSSNMSVETYAATFRSTNSRITVGTPIDSTTMSGDFLHGLKGPIAKALATHEPMSTMQDLELLMAAAEEMEAEISLSSKQAPTVNAAVLPRSHTFNSVGQGGYGPIRTINAQPGGGGGSTGNRGRGYRGHSAPRGGACFGSRVRTHAAASAGSRGGKASYCKHCRTSTHNTCCCVDCVAALCTC